MCSDWSEDRLRPGMVLSLSKVAGQRLQILKKRFVNALGPEQALGVDV
jgi:hypothetical protein